MQLNPGLVAGAASPTYLYVFKNRFALAPYLPRFNGKPEELSGYFQPRVTGNYVAIDGDARGPAEHVIYHEYLHFVLHSRFSRLPLWLDEGLAEYFGSFQVAEGEARVGMPIEEHIRWLRQNTLIPLQQLLAIDHTSKDYHEGLRQGVFYAESWALTHYLMVGNPARRPQLMQLAKLVEIGVPQDQAFAQAFGGDYAGLDHELRVYLDHPQFAYEHIPLRAGVQNEVAVTPLPPADALYRLGDLLLNLGADEQAAAAQHFNAALAIDPRHALATAGLGEIAERAHRLPEARAAYEKALALIGQAPAAAGSAGAGPGAASPASGAPSSGTVAPAATAAALHFLLGSNLLAAVEAARGNGGTDTAGQSEAVAAAAELNAATQLAPEFGEAWARLGRARLAIDPPPAGTVSACETAHRLLPARTDVTLDLATAYASAGDRKQATAAIEQARLAGADPGDLQQARETLLYADYNAAGKLVEAGDLAGAIASLERLAATSPDGDFHRQVVDQLGRLRQAALRQRYVETYNHAVDLANKGDLQGATAQLEALLAGTLPSAGASGPPPDDIAEGARNLLEAVKKAAAHHP